MTSLELAIATAIARDNLPERECRKCGELKGPGEFARDASKRDGLRTQCRACIDAYNARYYTENADKERERKARYRAENADKLREYRARYRAENAEKVREYSARYRAENAEKVRERKARWRAENRDKERERLARWRAKNADKERERKARWHAENAEKVRERHARWYAENRDKIRERNARWRAENPGKNRAKARRYRARKHSVYHAPYDEATILAGNGGICRYCDSAPATALDHFIPLSWGGDDAPWNLIGACQPCNSSKNDNDPYEWMASRGVDLDAWEARHIAGWFDLPAKLWKIAKVYRPPA